MSISKLVLSQVNQGFVLTPQRMAQIKAIASLRNLLKVHQKNTFQFLKNSTKNNVTSVNVDKTSIKGTIDSSHDYTFEATEADDNKKKDFENNLNNTDITVRHKSSGKVSPVKQLTALTYSFGVKATLRLEDEGEYEILIGGDASQYKPKSTTPQKSSQKPYWLP